MCPICVTSPTHSSRSRFVLLADHIAAVHDDGTIGGDEDPIVSSTLSQIRRNENDEVIYFERKKKQVYVF